MKGLEGKVGPLGAGWRPTPDMPPRPRHQQPFWVSGPWLGSPPTLSCFVSEDTEVEVEGGCGGQGAVCVQGLDICWEFVFPWHAY